MTRQRLLKAKRKAYRSQGQELTKRIEFLSQQARECLDERRSVRS
jgi:hypothetical protein